MSSISPIHPAARFTPSTISFAEATDLVFLGIPAVGERLSSLGPKAAAGARPKRACTVTFVQAIEWGAWASSWTAHQATAYSSLAPRSSQIRTLVRGHFTADLGPETNEEVTSHVSGSFDFWDDKASVPGG